MVDQPQEKARRETCSTQTDNVQQRPESLVRGATPSPSRRSTHDAGTKTTRDDAHAQQQKDISQTPKTATATSSKSKVNSDASQSKGKSPSRTSTKPHTSDTPRPSNDASMQPPANSISEPPSPRSPPRKRQRIYRDTQYPTKSPEEAKGGKDSSQSISERNDTSSPVAKSSSSRSSSRAPSHELHSDDEALFDDAATEEPPPTDNSPLPSLAKQREIDSVMRSLPDTVAPLEPDSEEEILVAEVDNDDEGFAEDPNSAQFQLLLSAGVGLSRRRMLRPGNMNKAPAEGSSPKVVRKPIRIRRRVKQSLAENTSES